MDRCEPQVAVIGLFSKEVPMKFMFILTHVEEAWNDAPPGEGERVYQQYMELERELRAENMMFYSGRLRSCREAKTIRNLPKDERAFVDGPWTKMKEVMGGYYIIECASMNEALDWAKRMPNYGHGSIEVRPMCE